MASMLQLMQKNLLDTSKIHLMRYHSTHNTGESANQCTIPDLSVKFGEILGSIKEYNDSLQKLETLSETVKENLNKFTEANSSTRVLNNSIKSEINSTIEKLVDGETKRVGIKDSICGELQNQLNQLGAMSYTAKAHYSESRYSKFGL